MNLDELRSAQAKERRKDSLQHLRDSFYDDVGAYVADLRAARDRRAEQVENPFADDDIRRLSDEVETAEEVAEALYERRVGKVVKLASFAAADMSVDEEGMTTEERRLFDDLVERITANKSEVLDVLAGESPVPDETPAADRDGRPPETEATPPTAEGRTADSERTGPAPVNGDSGPSDADPTPADADPEPSDPDTQSGDTGALAGAMGGDEGESPSGASSRPNESDAAPAAESAADGGDDPTPVPPEPAPPGAVGADDATDEGGGASDPLASDANEGSEPGATTDGGAVPESTAGGDPDAGSRSDAGLEPDASSRPDADPEPGRATERATVRITRDVGAIFGVDEREYELASEDVVSLPVENADPLVQRDAAERLD
jgi:DNA replication factor GINS